MIFRLLPLVVGLLLLLDNCSNSYRVSAALDVHRITATVCCERVDEVAPLLSSWNTACLHRRSSQDAPLATYMAMLHRSRRYGEDGASTPAVDVPQLCTEAGYLHQAAVEAMFVYRLCSTLPLSHRQLAQSPYGVFVDASPTEEDGLTALMELSCVEYQQHWRRKEQIQLWVSLLQQQRSIADMQAALCPQRCLLERDVFLGQWYDLK